MNILNKDLFLYDPTTRKLMNEGVANVNDDTRSSQALEVLRYELETFVCDGQYEHGLQLILESFLGNIGQAGQPSAWVSGFFGSGKSHLVKMLRALWLNTRFPDGATAQGIATLPDKIRDLLKELEGDGKRYGGLQAASGTLGAGSNVSVRLALLQIVFRSVNLPEQYPIARFVLWMKSQGILDQVRSLVEADGKNWQDELDSFFFAESLHNALVKVKPNIFSSPNVCVDLLSNQYPFVQDITSEEMVKSIREALSSAGKFPLTLLVLDEVQQYIGEDAIRSLAVQEVIEDCSKKFNGKLIVVATGQTAITGTSNLKKLEGRFTLRVELSDSDVDEVIRKVILAKKPDKIGDVNAFIQRNLGEITRHLADTKIRHRQSDMDDFSKDYPILPVRRRFWEEAFRVLDPTGTSAQLRNQLAMIHKVVKETAHLDLGYVIPADYLYFNTAMKLLGNKMLSRRYYDHTMLWIKGSNDEKLMARACALVYLINKIVDRNSELGIKATADTIADLLIVDLSTGSAPLRFQLPTLLDSCPLLMKIGEEYRVQTEENTAWNDEFGSQRAILENEAYRITGERAERLKKKVSDQLKKIQVLQGETKVKRGISLHYEAEKPVGEHKQITLWVRDGWMSTENTVVLEARQAGNERPTVHIFISKKNSEELHNAIVEYKSAAATLVRRGVPSTDEGRDAYSAMKTIMNQAETRINHLLDDVLSYAKVFQSGGNEISSFSLEAMIKEAVKLSLDRMYRYFDIADNEKWAKVFERAKGGSSDALSMINYHGEVAENPVCKEVLSFIGSGKKGSDIRSQFQDSPYGWPQDSVDGALLVLLASGIIRAVDRNGNSLKATEIERKAIGPSSFKVETVVLSPPQKVHIRKLMVLLHLNANSTNLGEYAGKFLNELENLANLGGGESPKPEKPNTQFIDELRMLGGNDLLYAIYTQASLIEKSITEWKKLAKKIEKSWPNWVVLKNLAMLAKSIDEDGVYRSQVSMIEQRRQLLTEPNLVEPLIKSLNQFLREELNELEKSWDAAWDVGEMQLASDDNWNKLEPEQKHALRLPRQLMEKSKPAFEVEDSVSIIKTLQSIGLEGLKDRIGAMHGRYGELLVESARMMEPKAQVVTVKRQTLYSSDEVDAWLEETGSILSAALEQGPVVVQ